MVAGFTGQVAALKLELRASGKQAVVATARQAFADAQRQNKAELGYEPPFEQIVDGRKGAALETIQPGGKIIFLFDTGAAVLTKAVDFAIEKFLQIAPVGARGDPHPGRFRDSLILLVNGRRRDAARGGPVTFKPNDLVQLTSLLPYSRRLEIGKTESGRAFGIQVPEGSMHEVLQSVHSRYGRLVRAELTYENYGPAFAIGAGRKGSVAARRRASSYPTVTIRLK